MTETPLAEAACTCKVTGRCDTCKRWHATITEIVKRTRDEKEARQ